MNVQRIPKEFHYKRIRDYVAEGNDIFKEQKWGIFLVVTPYYLKYKSTLHKHIISELNQLGHAFSIEDLVNLN